MKKSIYVGVFLIFAGTTFIGCEKENSDSYQGNIQNKSNLSVGESEFMIELIENINRTKNNFQSNKSVVDPSYSTNPYDQIGIDHNSQLTELHNHPEFTLDGKRIVQLFNDIHF